MKDIFKSSKTRKKLRGFGVFFHGMSQWFNMFEIFTRVQTIVVKSEAIKETVKKYTGSEENILFITKDFNVLEVM
ncbi:MAG: hypothetical protein JW776_11150 [Candidatus Lokiarchaeota archaeon]|nr:hypothetical protein [Candidatus Lokiarchaeota archaeon]